MNKKFVGTVSEQIEDTIEEIQVVISKIIAEERLASLLSCSQETTLRRLENEKVQMRGMMDGLNQSLKFIKWCIEMEDIIG